MRHFLNNAGCILLFVVTLITVLSWGWNVIDYGVDLTWYLRLGWRAWLPFVNGMLALLCFLSFILSGCFKEVPDEV